MGTRRAAQQEVPTALAIPLVESYIQACPPSLFHFVGHLFVLGMPFLSAVPP